MRRDTNVTTEYTVPSPFDNQRNGPNVLLLKITHEHKPDT